MPDESPSGSSSCRIGRTMGGAKAEWWPLFLVAIGISMAWKEVVRRRVLEHERVE